MDHEKETPVMDDSGEPKVLGMLAQFNTPDEVVTYASGSMSEMILAACRSCAGLA